MVDLNFKPASQSWMVGGVFAGPDSAGVRFFSPPPLFSWKA